MTNENMDEIKPKAPEPRYYSRSIACFICDTAPGEEHMRSVRHKRHRYIVVCERCCTRLILADALLPFDED